MGQQQEILTLTDQFTTDISLSEAFAEMCRTSTASSYLQKLLQKIRWNHRLTSLSNNLPQKGNVASVVRAST